jgi:hypothetical protein
MSIIDNVLKKIITDKSNINIWENINNSIKVLVSKKNKDSNNYLYEIFFFTIAIEIIDNIKDLILNNKTNKDIFPYRVYQRTLIYIYEIRAIKKNQDIFSKNNSLIVLSFDNRKMAIKFFKLDQGDNYEDKKKQIIKTYGEPMHFFEFEVKTIESNFEENQCYITNYNKYADLENNTLEFIERIISFFEKNIVNEKCKDIDSIYSLFNKDIPKFIKNNKSINKEISFYMNIINEGFLSENKEVLKRKIKIDIENIESDHLRKIKSLCFWRKTL